MERSGRLGVTRLVVGMLIACLIVGTFVGFTARAAVGFTGSVVTTDDLGVPKDTYFRGENVYVNVELKNQGIPYSGSIRVELVRASDGWTADWLDDVTDDPDIGWYNSSQAGPPRSLSTFAGISGDLAVYNVIVYETWSWTQIGFTSIVVLNTGLWMEPTAFLGFYPQEEVTISLVTSHTTDVFYAEIVNETGVTKVNWTGQVAIDGYWSTVWTIPSDFPDGVYILRIRDSDTHAIWESEWFMVVEYIIVTSPDRDCYLPGESAVVSYSILSLATLEVQYSVDLTYSAYWLNSSGGSQWSNGTIAGGSGVHAFNIPADIALYYDVVIDYWIDEGSGTRTAETDVWLYLGTLDAQVTVDPSTYMPGDTVRVSVDAQVGWSALPGAVVNVVVTRQGAVVAEYGASGRITDAYGATTHSFQLASNESQGTLVVNATVSKAGQSVTRMTTLEVQWNGGILIDLDRDRYNAGDRVTATFQVYWNNEFPSGQTVTYIVGLSSGILLIGNTTSGSVSFDLPPDYYGVLWMQAVVNLDGYLLMNMHMAEVVLSDVIVNAVKDRYDASDVIEFDYTVVSMAAGSTLRYDITNSMGMHVAGGPLPVGDSGTVQYTAPAMPAESYTCVVSLATQGGMVISDYDTAYLEDQYELVIQVLDSSHLLGSFEPGETAVMEYTILEHSLPHLAAYDIRIVTSWGDEWVLTTTDTSGTADLTIPDEASSGWVWVEVSLQNAATGDWLDSAEAMLAIDTSAAEWDLVIDGLQDDIASLADQISDQENITLATLEDLWDEINATQAAIDALMVDLQATQDAVGISNDNIELIMADLEAMDARLEDLQTQLGALQDDVDAVEEDVSARPTGDSVVMWLAIAVVVLIVAGVAIAFVMKKKA